jgi:hypothetical protein
MKKIPNSVYQTAEEIAAVIKEREAEAAALVPGMSRQSVLIDVAQLRAYADIKHWVLTPSSPAKGDIACKT